MRPVMGPAMRLSMNRAMRCRRSFRPPESWRDRGPAAAPLRLVAFFYGVGAALHRTLHRARILPRRRLACRVVSVGSLVVGGSAKTPTAAWIAARLHARGHKVVLASRGYGGRSREPVLVVSDGQRLRVDAGTAGDESLVLARHAPGVPVLVGRDRGRVGLRAIATFGAEVLVLDDGAQHHRLQRDIEIMSFDAVHGFGNRQLLPAGPLREWARGLARADAIGVVDGELSSMDESLLDQHAPSVLRYHARRRPHSLRRIAPRPGDDDDTRSLAWLRDREVGVVLGLANPESFERSIEALGARIVARRLFADHHRYAPEDLTGMAESARCWVTSEKDALKIAPVWLDDVDLRVLVIELEVEDSDGLMEWLDRALGQGPREVGRAGR